MTGAVLGLGCAACGVEQEYGPTERFLLHQPGSEAEASEAPGPRPVRGGLLPAGLHRTTRFQPPLTFEVRDPWSAPFGPDTEGHLLLTTTNLQSDPNELQRLLTIAHLSQVFATPLFDSTRPIEDQLIPAPDDALAWLSSNPYLTVGARVSTSIGGQPAQEFTLSVGQLPPRATEDLAPCPLACVVLWHDQHSGAITYLLEGEHLYGWTVRSADAELLILAEAPPDDMSVFLEEVRTLLGTLHFG